MGVAESIFGLAYGDAMGKPTEFKKVWEIKRIYGKRGIRDLPPARVPSPYMRWDKQAKRLVPDTSRKRVHTAPVTPVTDDTEMALAVGEALVQARGECPGKQMEYDPVADALTQHFIKWEKNTDGSRAPGSACMKACYRLSVGRPWWEATDVKSKGCGANMRVTPIGCASWLSDEERAGIAQLQAAMTHAHPTALAAADATQQAVWLLLNGTRPEDLIEALLEYVEDQMGVYHQKWLGLLYTWDDERTGEGYINRGWIQVQKALLNVLNATYRPSRNIDPCLLTGAGWIAEEALATALYCFLIYPDNGQLAISRAANTSGDSDSIAALAGAFAGAHLGPGAFPADWRQRIEFRDRLAKLVKDLV